MQFVVVHNSSNLVDKISQWCYVMYFCFCIFHLAVDVFLRLPLYAASNNQYMAELDLRRTTAVASYRFAYGNRMRLSHLRCAVLSVDRRLCNRPITRHNRPSDPVDGGHCAGLFNRCASRDRVCVGASGCYVYATLSTDGVYTRWDTVLSTYSPTGTSSSRRWIGSENSTWWLTYASVADRHQHCAATWRTIQQQWC